MTLQHARRPTESDVISESGPAQIPRFAEQESNALIAQSLPAVAPETSLLDEVAGEEQPETVQVSLSAAEVARARSYYVTQPGKYTPEVISEIQGAVGVSPSGKIDDETIQGVAGFQAEINRSRRPSPPLAVDGIAGPRTLPILLPVGLATQDSVDAYVADVNALEPELAAATTPKEKADLLAGAAGARLAAAGVPPLEEIVVAGDVNRFTPSDWQITLSPKILDDPERAAAVLYHEARHAEQSWRIARMLAGKGKTPAQISTETGVPLRIAELARAQPITPGTTEALQAEGWHEQEIGHESSEQSKARMGVASGALVSAISAWKKDPTPQSEARMNAAYTEYIRSYLAYRNQPEEYDGFFVEDRVRDGLGVARDKTPTLEELQAQVPG